MEWRVKSYALPFAATVLASSLAAGLALFLQTGELPAGKPGNLVMQFGVAVLICLPVIATVGLMVALPLERLMLRQANAATYFLTSVGLAAVVSIVVEQLIFQAPYRSFGSILLPSTMAGFVAAITWHQMVRIKETVDHA